MRGFVLQIAIIGAAAWLLTLLPSPTPAVPLRLKNGLVAIFAVLAVGKALYDTLFYDHYRP